MGRVPLPRCGVSVCELTALEVPMVSETYLRRADTGFRCFSGRPLKDLLRLGFRQSSFHHTMRVLQGVAFCIFSATPALQACCCPLWVSPPGKPLTLEPSSKFYPFETGIPCRVTRRTSIRVGG